jgi:hypothetical protein
MRFTAQGSVAEIACQQVLLQDGTIYSVQWLVVPERHAHPVTAHLLLERYLKLVRHFTLSLVRPVSAADGIQFRLVGTCLDFLSFAPPEYLSGERIESVQLRTVGGLLVRADEPGRGKFSFLVEREESGVRITVQLFYSRPLLLGSGHPSTLRRLFFRNTQGKFHKTITVRFLSELYRDLTGDKARISVKQARVKEGQDI